MNEFLNSWSPRILSVLRFISGFLMLWHGTQKLFNYPPKDGFTAAAGLMLVAGILEFAGGILLAVGLFTRWTAFVMSGLMAVAYFMAHASGGFLPIVNKGELAVLYCFVYFYLFFAGGGVWSLDNLLQKKN
ncbi:MAG: DoxX family protein [Pyrinomonadaceae bacterium]|nr:DoxX family protein [Pyrinomonadaceae bacterium]